MIRTLLSGLAFLTLGACATPAPHQKAAAPLLIENVTVVEVATGLLRPGESVLVQGGRIAAAGKKLAAPAGTRRFNAKGRFALPGLWDMHAHHEAVGEGALPLFLAQGVVGTRDMGGRADFILPLKARVRSGELLGPEIVAAGPILDAASTGLPLRRRVANAGEARAAVRELAAAGADFIKVHDETSRESYFAIADEARRLGLPFAGHIPAAVRADEAVEAGQSSVEHLSSFQIFLQCSGGSAYSGERCAPFFRRLADRKVWQTPTLAFMGAIPDLIAGKPIAHSEFASKELEDFGRANQEASKLPPEAVAWLRTQSRASLNAVRDMKAAGVPFLAGCDALVPGFCLHDELALLVRAGFTPLEALQAATIGPARYLGREATDGSIAAGRNADILLLDANPLEDIANTRRIHAVVARGRLLRREKLDMLLADARRR